MIYINYPEWISPQIIPGLPFHWYGMMYLVAFGITYLLFNYQRKHGEIAVSEDQMAGIFFLGYSWPAHWSENCCNPSV